MKIYSKIRIKMSSENNPIVEHILPENLLDDEGYMRKHLVIPFVSTFPEKKNVDRKQWKLISITDEISYIPMSDFFISKMIESRLQTNVKKDSSYKDVILTEENISLLEESFIKSVNDHCCCSEDDAMKLLIHNNSDIIDSIIEYSI